MCPIKKQKPTTPVKVDLVYSISSGVFGTSYAAELITKDLKTQKVYTKRVVGMVEGDVTSYQVELEMIETILLDHLNLKEGRPIRLIIHSTSGILSKNINQNIHKWSRNKWLKSNGSPPKHLSTLQVIHQSIKRNYLYLRVDYKQNAKGIPHDDLVIELAYIASLESGTISLGNLIRYNQLKKAK